MAKKKKEGTIETMVVRNRLVAFLLRLTFFVLLWISYPVYVASFESAWTAFCTMSVELGTVFLVMVGFELIFNLIDLIRHGLHGVAAGPYMPFALPITVFTIISGILYFSTLLPNGDAPGGVFGIMLHVVLIAAPLIDWLFLDEKGTCPVFAVITWQIYPILFHIFGYFRTVIWPNDAIYRGNMYALPFLNYLDPFIVWKSIAFFAITLGGACLAVFLNDVLSGKFRPVKIQID